MPITALDEKPQWCHIHQGNCREVNLLRREMGNWAIICTKCAAVLQKLGMVKAGPKVAGHATLQLAAVAPIDRNLPRRPYLITLEKEHVIAMRAIGYEILEDDSDYGDLFEEEYSEV